MNNSKQIKKNDVVFCGSDNHLSFEALKLLASKANVLFFQVEEPLSDTITSFCCQHGITICKKIPINNLGKIDLLISFCYQKLIDASLIEKARIAINFHPAPLPYYRGKATGVQALLKGEQKWGATCHFLSETFDTGNIIERRWFDITEEMQTGYSLSYHSWNVCLQMLKSMLDQLLDGVVPEGHPQEATGNYYSLKKLIALKKLSLDEPVEVIDRKVSAIWYPPYEGAYIEIEGKKFYLINEQIMKEINSLYEK